VTHSIIKLFLKQDKKAFEKFYNINIKTQDVFKIIEIIANKKAHLLKGGRIDENRTISLIVRDWQQGRLKL